MLENAKLIAPWTQTIGLLDTSSHTMNAAQGAAQLRQMARRVERRFGAPRYIDRPADCVDSHDCMAPPNPRLFR